MSDPVILSQTILSDWRIRIMGILSSVFGKKGNNQKPAANPSLSKLEIMKGVSKKLKGEPDANGLYPSELVMLSLAERYKVDETDYPKYLSNKYEIENPVKMLKNLCSRGFIKVGSPMDILPSYTLPELKELAASLGATVKGNKADIIVQLSEIGDSRLREVVTDRPWKLTQTGDKALKDNLYIQFFLEKHPYDLNIVGVNIWTVNEEYVKNPKRSYRDIIFHQISKKQFKDSVGIQKNPLSGNTYEYCECFRLMGLFMEEEGKSFSSAADYYFQYLYRRQHCASGRDPHWCGRERTDSGDNF